MAEINFSQYAKWAMPVYMERKNPVPLDGSELYYSVEAATTYANNKTLAYVGQSLSVVESDESGNYVTKRYVINENSDGTRYLSQLGEGSGKAENSESYNEALSSIATSDNVGKIINVESASSSYMYVEYTSGTPEVFTEMEEVKESPEEGDDEFIKVGEKYYQLTRTDYSPGLYIVTGEGSIAKLGTSSASGDLDSAVVNLETKVGSVDSKVSTIENAMYYEGDDEEPVE